MILDLTRVGGTGHMMVYRRGSKHEVNDGALYIKFRSTSGTWSLENKNLAGDAIAGWPVGPPAAAGRDAGEPQLYIAPNNQIILHSWDVDYNVAQNGTFQWFLGVDGSPTSQGQIDFANIANDVDVFSTDDSFVYNGVIYAGARSHPADDQLPSSSYLIRNTANGAVGSWEVLSTIGASNEGGGSGFWEVGLTLLPDLTILAVLRDTSALATYKRISQPPYTSWGTLTDITSQVGRWSRARIYHVAELQGLANWWLDKRLLMVGFTNEIPGSSTTRRIRLATSKNAGTTWKTLAIDNTSEDGGYGDIAWDPVSRKWVYVSYHGTLAQADTKEYLLDIKGFS